MPGKLPAADVQLIRAEILPNLGGKVFHVWLLCAEQLWHIPTGLFSTKTQSICPNRELCPRYLAPFESPPSMGHSLQTHYQKGVGARELTGFKILI